MRQFNPKKLPMIWAVIFFVFGALVILNYLGDISSSNITNYENTEIKGIVDEIAGFNRGFPILIVNGNRFYIHQLPPSFGKYILPGDSISKNKGSFEIVSFRKKGKIIEAIEWKYSIINGYEQPDIRKTNHIL